VPYGHRDSARRLSSVDIQKAAYLGAGIGKTAEGKKERREKKERKKAQTLYAYFNACTSLTEPS